jgi:pyruvate dehydrogenase E2 component (dihydrolipoamide acetyltransferase)
VNTLKDFKLPDLGENIESGDIVQVLVKEGDVISPEQPVVEIETDKAVVEVPCPFGGRIVKVHIQPGQKVKVGATLVTVEEAEGAAPAGPAAEAPAQAPAKAPEAAKAADAETAQPAVAGKAPPPATPAPPTAPPARAEEPAAPRPEQPAAAPYDILKPEPAAATPTGPSPGRSKVSRPVGPPPQPKLAEGEPIPAGPATRRLARELGVDLSEVAAANPGERLTEEHIKRFVRERSAGLHAAPAGAGPAVHVPPLPDFAQWGPVERVPFSSLQRKTAEHLSASWLIAPHVTQCDEADVTELEALRKRFQQSAADKGKPIKLTVTAFILKAATVALKEFPQFNASLDSAAGQLVLKRYYHLGVAVDTPAGLIVPVIRDVDKKTILQIANEMNEVAERTRNRKIGIEELRGGTFTITNLGGIGGTYFTPIINYPEVAILGVSRAREVPVLRDGQLATKLMLPLSLSYDHRVINGADGARFLRRVAGLLEDPELLLLEG